MAEQIKKSYKDYPSGDVNYPTRKGAMKRRLQAYPGVRNYMLIIARTHSMLQPISSTVDEIISYYFEHAFNDMQRDKLLRTFENMTPEERKNPGKI